MSKSIDPAIIELKRQHKENVAKFRHNKASAKLLKTILEKRLPQMTQEDKNKLADVLIPCTTPKLV